MWLAARLLMTVFVMEAALYDVMARVYDAPLERIMHPEPREPIMHTEPREPIMHTEPREPIMHTEPREPIMHTEPREPIMHTEPREPIMHTEPREPIMHTEPREPIMHTEPREPIMHTEPREPIMHTEPREPIMHTEPREPIMHTEPPFTEVMNHTTPKQPIAEETTQIATTKRTSPATHSTATRGTGPTYTSTTIGRTSSTNHSTATRRTWPTYTSTTIGRTSSTNHSTATRGTWPTYTSTTTRGTLSTNHSTATRGTWPTYTSTTTRGTTGPAQPFKQVNISCDNHLWFYADGQPIVNDSTPAQNDWRTVKHVNVPGNTKVYAIKCVDVGVVAGIIASFSDGSVTDGTWKCTHNKPSRYWLYSWYDDSSWSPAYTIHKNNGTVPYWGTSWMTDISSDAQWIWTRGWTGRHTEVYCRKLTPDEHHTTKNVTGSSTSTSTTTSTTTTSTTTTFPTTEMSAHWGSWGSWSMCSGDCDTATQTRTRTCLIPKSNEKYPDYDYTHHPERPYSEPPESRESMEYPVYTDYTDYSPCDGRSSEDRKCYPTAVQAEDCVRCQLNAANIGYLSSCADASLFYQCTRSDDGTFIVYPMACPNCTVWSQNLLTCIQDPTDIYCRGDSQGGNGNQNPIVVGDRCYTRFGQYGAVMNEPAMFYQHSNGMDYLMSCPPGTIFNLTRCLCDHAHVTVPVTKPPQVQAEMCITFEKMTRWSKWGFSDEGVHVGNHDINNDNNWQSKHVQMSRDSKVGTKSGYFDGMSFLTINSLANSFSTWSEFTISFWYKPDRINSHMGFLTNGLVKGCSSSPTVSMTYDNSRIRAMVFATGTAVVAGQTNSNDWTHVSLTWDSYYATLYINGHQTDRQKLQGTLVNSQCPMMIGLDAEGSPFKGYMDQICLYRAAVAPASSSNPTPV